VRGDGELSSVPEPSLWSVPWARDPGESARPRNNGRRQILPSAWRKQVGLATIRDFGADPHGLATLLSTLRTHQSPGEWQDSLLTCLLDFDQAGFAPAG